MSDRTGYMSEYEHTLHLLAGLIYGRDATCGPEDQPKVDYRSIDSAAKAVTAMNNRPNVTKMLEEYPCAWCGGWHIGREMDRAERLYFRALLDKAEETLSQRDR
jgi:hypothetical protein